MTLKTGDTLRYRDDQSGMTYVVIGANHYANGMVQTIDLRRSDGVMIQKALRVVAEKMEKVQ